MPFWLKSKTLAWTNPERASSRYSSKSQVCARRRPRGRRTPTIVLPGSLTEAPRVESLVAYHSQSTSDRIPEEILGIDRKLLEASSRCNESSPCPCQTSVGQRSWQIATTVITHQSNSWKVPLRSTLWQMQRAHILQHTEDADRRDHPLYRRHRCLD